MKSSVIKITVTILLFTLISGCKKNDIINDEQLVLFQFDHINYAWGFEHIGFYIDAEGNILTYINPEKWNFYNKSLILSHRDILENLSECTPGSFIVDEDELLKYAGYIKHIASSKVTAMKNMGADAGITEFTCWQFSENTGEYTGYLIKMEGDFTCENLNYFSKKVVSWMKDIYRDLDHL